MRKVFTGNFCFFQLKYSNLYVTIQMLLINKRFSSKSRLNVSTNNAKKHDEF